MLPGTFRLKLKQICLLAFVALLILAGCAPPAGTDPTAAPQESPPATNTAEIPPTPTAAPGKVILVQPQPGQNAQYLEVKPQLEQLARESRLGFEEVGFLQPADIQPDWKVIVLFETNEQLPEALSAHPDKQFLVFSSVALGAGANLNVIQLRPEMQAFTAGLVSVLAAPDWRAGGMFTPDEPLGSLMADAYQTGGKYFCGICNSYFAPITLFPITTRVSASSDSAAWQANLEQFRQSIVYFIYVSNESSSPELLTDLASRQYLMAGANTPPDEIRGAWAATIAFDLNGALNEIWPAVLSGQGGSLVYAPITLRDVNTALLTAGRIRLVENAIVELETGLVYPSYVAP